MIMNLNEARDLVRGFHDATLVAVELRWEEGIAIIVTRTSIGQKRIVVHGVVCLACARAFPWGQSVSINQMGVSGDPDSALLQVTIEMQSGDALVVHGSSISVD